MPKTYCLKSQPSTEPLNSLATFQMVLCNSLRSNEAWLLNFALALFVFSINKPLFVLIGVFSAPFKGFIISKNIIFFLVFSMRFARQISYNRLFENHF